MNLRWRRACLHPSRGGWRPALHLSCALAVLCGAPAGSGAAWAAVRPAPAGLAQARSVDAGSVLAQARAAVARGRYTEAEALLTPIATRTPNSDAAVELGLLLRMLGRNEEATRLFDQILDAVPGTRPQAADFVRLARVARALGEFKAANTAFESAAALAPNDPAINTAWGELALDAHDNRKAAESFKAAIAADPKSVAARLGLAGALGGENPPEALTLVKQALSLDATSVPARLLLAELELDRGNRDVARALVAAALDVNPASLDAHALAGAIAYVEGHPETFQAEVAAALKVNPRYGEAYRVAGDLAARNYRFDEAVILTRQAIALDGNNARAHADLGMHLLRTGDEAGARRELERAFGSDPYDVVTYNLLDLLDRLDKFQTSRDGSVVLRLDPAEAPILGEYAGALANRALSEIAARYKFTLSAPVLVEIFPRHDDFAVRTMGLPGLIGALGACFGRVVTVDSPKARPPGDFHWGETLWHELAHVVTLQLSRQRVPRWLTEGISVYEEQRASPDWGREMEIPFAEMRRRGQIMSLRELNAGFTNPKTIAIAYYEASLVVDHIVSTYGDDALRKLLLAYGMGLEDDAALKGGLGVGIDLLQTGFDQMLDKRFTPLQKALEAPPGLADATLGQIEKIAAANPGSYPAQLVLGEGLWRAGRLDDAFRALGRAAELVPMATGESSPHAMMARMALERGDKPRAAAELEALLAHASTDIESARQLAGLLQGGNPSRLAAAYERIVALDPFDAGAHSALGRLALEREDHQVAAREFRAALAAGPLDPAVAHCDLAESYLMGGDRDQAKRQALAALEIAPSYERAQELLLKLVEGAP
jgi:cellulose synthase operon protein C